MLIERLMRLALAGATWVLYLLLALSVISIAAMAERFFFFRKHADDVDALERDVDALLRDGDLVEVEWRLAKSPSIEAKSVVYALRWAHGGAQAFADALEAEVARQRKELERGLTFIGTLGNNAPFIGLFGTVVGVIEAFHHLGSAAQNQSAMGSMMAGIAEALIATGVGLFVAIPAVVAYNVAQKRIGDIEAGAVSLGKRGHELHPHRSARGSRAAQAHGRAAAPNREPAGRSTLLHARRRSRQAIVGINMTPFVDIALVLLVIMMVSANYIVAQSLKVELPKAANSDGSTQSIAAVTLLKDKSLYYGDEKVDEAGLVQKLRAAKASSGEVNLVVKADQEAQHGAVVRIIDLAKTEGISKFSINVERQR
jgi:biopolymer transport protein ExbB/TolQ/biopolymer transport protein ExbD